MMSNCLEFAEPDANGRTVCPVLIIGAGPAGLALAYELKRRGTQAVVLERADKVGDTFQRMAEGTEYGPWHNNLLPGPALVVPWYDMFRRTRREEYAFYLERYSHLNELDVRTGIQVAEVKRQGLGDFVVHTTSGEFCAPLLVNATGYFGRPLLPRYPGAEQSSIRQMHACDYREPSTVRDLLQSKSGSVLIVGKRLTAGETMKDLCEAGYRVSISHRSPIQSMPWPWLQACVFPLTMLLEEALVKLMPKYRPWNLRITMNRSEHIPLITSGRVRTYPDIERFASDTVVFTNGACERFDLVIYATGYLPVMAHLEGFVKLDPVTGYPPLRDLQSREQPGLYFLGLVDSRTFRSQFLRGLREDATYLAEKLAGSDVRTAVSV
ncbi:NAD(P)-binding domain-containing protein [bacterium]|nr:NAD(P)-binding domain-containing protein [bacterium]